MLVNLNKKPIYRTQNDPRPGVVADTKLNNIVIGIAVFVIKHTGSQVCAGGRMVRPPDSFVKIT